MLELIRSKRSMSFEAPWAVVLLVGSCWDAELLLAPRFAELAAELVAEFYFYSELAMA